MGTFTEEIRVRHRRLGDLPGFATIPFGRDDCAHCKERWPCDVSVVLTALAAVEARTWEAAAERARTFFAPSDEPADISARECGELIADALADRARPPEAAGG